MRIHPLTRTALCCGLLLCCVLVLLTPAHGADVFGRSPLANPAPAHVWPMPQALRATLAAGMRWQGMLNARLADALEQVHAQGPAGAVGARWIIVLASFAYGVLHALGPGHGKLGVAAYLVSHRARFSHAAWLSAWSALAQALCAIGLVLALHAVFHDAPGVMLDRAAALELCSYLALLGVGAWTLWSVATRRDCCDVGAVRARWPDTKRARALDALDATAPASTLYEQDTYLAHALRPGAARWRLPAPRHDAPASGVWVARQIFFTGLALGLRPCAGALFVLLTALAYGVLATGVLAALAMAAGVALTVLLIALASVGANRALTRRAVLNRPSLERLRRTLALGGAAFICVFAACQCVWLIAGLAAPSLS
jgi:nickel/cobalt exporter